MKPGKDCYVISNSLAANDNADGSYLDSTNGSPTIHDIPISRSASDSKDYAVATGMRNAQSYDAFPTKRKHRQGGRNKSCEIDYQPDNQENGSDIDGIMYSPAGIVGRKKTSHRRQKSNSAAKELGVGTDTGSLEFVKVFCLVRRMRFFVQLRLVLYRILRIRVVEASALSR